MRLNKKIAKRLTGLVLVGSFLTLTGCATMGANMALSLAKEEEAKGCEASQPKDKELEVSLEQCERITRIIKKVIPTAFVGYDRFGFIKLKGSYATEADVDLAHMIATTIVGTSGVKISPITPRELGEIRMTKSYVPQQSSGNGQKYALLIGVSKFKFNNDAMHLDTPDDDALQIENFLKNQGFKENNIHVLIDEKATKDNIKNEMKDLVAKVTPNDSVVFYISSHGTPPNMLGKMGVVPYDLKLASSIKSENIQKEADAISSDEKGDAAVIKIAKDRMESLKTALAFDDLQDFMNGIKTNKFVAVLDTCYSGGALKAISYPIAGGVYARKEERFVQSQSQENMRDMVGNGAICEKSGYDQKRIQSLSAAFNVGSSNKGGKNLFVDENDTHEKNQNVTHSTSKKVVGNDYDYSWLEDYRLLQNLYGLSEIDHGKVIITASSGEEKSWTADEFTTSIFTNYFLKGLNSYKGTYSAFDYAKVRTEKAAMDIKHHHQTPQMISSPGACVNINLSK